MRWYYAPTFTSQQNGALSVVSRMAITAEDNGKLHVSNAFSSAPLSSSVALILVGITAGPMVNNGAVHVCVQTKIYHYASLPNAGGPTPTGTLVAVSAISPTDIWAVGSYSQQTSPSTFEDRTLTEHWNGSQWSVIPSANPSPNSLNNDLYGVAAISTNDVWAVGAYDGATGSTALIEHWNGSTWQAIAHPAVSVLYGVAAASSTGVWAVGRIGGDPVMEHWNGTNWQLVATPPESGQFNAISVISATDIWAVGENDVYPTLLTVTEHWNGSSWSIITSPNTPDDQDCLLSVVATSDSDVWAVGYDQQQTASTLVEHFGALGAGRRIY